MATMRVALLAVLAATAVGAEGAATLMLYEGSDQQQYFRVLAGEEKLLRSEGYTSKAGAMNGLGSVVFNGVAAGNYRVHETKDGRWYFTLRAQNYKTIAVSSGYFGSQPEAETGVGRVVEALRGVLRSGRDVYVNAAEGAVSFVLLRSRNGHSHFHLRMGDGQRTVFAHGFRTEAEALEGMVQVFVAGHSKKGYEERVNAAGEHFFRLLHPVSGTQLATSNMFSTVELRDNARDLAHAGLRALVERVVATVVVGVPPAPPANVCGAAEQTLLEAVYLTKDGVRTPRMLYMSESDYPVHAKVVSATAATLPATAEEFRVHTATENRFGTVIRANPQDWFSAESLYDTTDEALPSQNALKAVGVFRQASEVALYRYPDQSGVVIDYYLAARYNGCSKLFIASWVSIET